ncbi:hypothetical protein PHYBLDRAFT_58534 [Phycomyces blakesleeanus NRRL 1555(-)]|uniref:Uncharacterized protein n=1 Tax=Phycomyces blakesleeanus (strain ATCC 8743b / DSM 1359 / FGSC 10004 / NBRC 33097 / NRRL 1555) TaxID=763407 RepID=A0A167QCK2_PHYB8|nr:hypothetical protein PHYBLDRAFT_58534 [Phycomyces blakesleeanus NRRL 1555(-)]OAD79486.1 hypothetical protein PHYBLDRAFT_58534 [Phycomyces blakesleeanus NRRL 1555(-)]|eukprot:XP_018297526.1 hypothetical protein PHYBLDRAFT_58534 [Phycomyces blakesleeanus NRRL 1555(-)]
MGYKTKMASFGENNEVIMLQLSTDEVEHVLVTYDKSTFYSNNGKEAMWLVEAENPIRKKDLDISHDYWEVFHPEANRDGYWTSAHMLKQLESNPIPLFKVIHPGCKAVFVFNQSDKEVEKDDLCTLRDTTFVQDGEKQRLDYKKDASEDSKCCAHHFLASQPDFMSQKTALHEAVKVSGHIFELYPKFYCECNWIERYWGTAKREARLQCDYRYKSLDKNIHSFLDYAGKLQNI